MRSFLCLLILCLGFFSAPAWCMEAFLGRIESISSGEGIMQVQILESSKQGLGIEEKKTISINFDPEAGPRCLKENSVIRFWGVKSEVDSKMYNAQAIRPFRSKGRDATGVRSRLKRKARGKFHGRGQGRKR